jgi:HEAT repeat protein
VRDRSADVRAEAVAALAERGSLDRAHTEALHAALDDPDATVRQTAAAALGRRPAADAGELIDALERDPDACDEIAAQLVARADEHALGRLAELAEHKSSAVRRAAVRCLARVSRTPEAAPAVLNAYEEDDGSLHPLL